MKGGKYNLRIYIMSFRYLEKLIFIYTHERENSNGGLNYKL
jgi:hypothetical protein